jgi:hypothetical protein
MAEKTKLIRRRKKKRELRKNIGISLFVVAMIVIVILSLFLQTAKKERADIYFEFSEASAEGRLSENNSSIFIRQMWFNVTAVKGKAKEVFILPPGMVSREDAPYYAEILQGESKEAIVMFPHELHFTKGNNSYPVKFQVSCWEAFGEVTIYITNFYPLISG